MIITKSTMSDHEFADYLRRQDALGNYRQITDAVEWRNDAGKVVAISLYDNANSTREIFCVE